MNSVSLPKKQTGRRALTGYLPTIDRVKWKALGLNDKQMDELERLIDEADKKNMYVNELMAKVEEVVGLRTKVAAIFDVTPTMVSRRLKHGIGAMDRVHPKVTVVEISSDEVESRLDLYPYSRHLKHLLEIFGVYQDLENRILMIYMDDYDRFENSPKELYDLLRSFNIGKKRASMIVKLYYQIEGVYDVSR